MMCYSILTLDTILFIRREFCGMVRKISIYTKEEVRKMNPGTLSCRSEEEAVVGEGSDPKDAKSASNPSLSSAGHS